MIAATAAIKQNCFRIGFDTSLFRPFHTESLAPCHEGEVERSAILSWHMNIAPAHRQRIGI
jgi:hypothetical protein